MAAGFASHFEALATPNDDNQFNEEYFDLVTYDKLLIEGIAESQQSGVVPVTSHEIDKIIDSFKRNKAQDIFGIAAEHLKYAPPQLSEVVAEVITYILKSGHIPNQLKEGILTPVPKKNKDPTFTNQL